MQLLSGALEENPNDQTLQAAHIQLYVIQAQDAVGLQEFKEKSIETDRLKEARATGADVLATACPKCQIHYQCAMKDPNIGDEIGIEMRDVAQLALEALGDGDASQ